MMNLKKPKKTPLIKIYDKTRNNNIYLKDETQQYTNAFKYRGVYNKCKNINFSNYNGIVTASTGNHAQAVSFISDQLKVKCVVFIPFNTPIKKQEKILKYNAKIQKSRKIKTYQQCMEEAIKYSKINNYIYIPSFDDLDIIKGHQSMFDEIDMSRIDYCFCPIGGGGLISSLLTYGGDYKVYGVELVDNDDMNQSLNAGRIVDIDLNIREKNSYCEGMLVSRVGDITFSIAKKYGLDVMLVTETDIKKSIIDLNEINIKAEGAGASSYAAYKKTNIVNSNVLCIISGGNIDNKVFELIIKG